MDVRILFSYIIRIKAGAEKKKRDAV